MQFSAPNVWQRSLACVLLLWLAAPLALRAANTATLTPVYLRCEYRVNPLGIDEPQPRLSWQVQSPRRGDRQTACQILVASSPALLRQNHGDLWDTGRTPGDETIGTVYRGAPLRSEEHCYWKVCVWGKDGQAAWSPPAQWSMGLLRSNDWQAAWIGYDAARQTNQLTSTFSDAKWIWLAADGAVAPAGARLFRKVITLPPNVNIKNAILTAAADDSFHFAINHAVVLSSPAGNDSWHHPQQTNVASSLKGGDNELLVEAENASPGSAGLLASLVITTEDGQVLRHVTDGAWQAAISPGTQWLTASLPADSWTPGKVLGDYGVAPWGQLEVADIHLFPVPYMRSIFAADKPVTRATLYASALGLVEARVNGRRVSDDYLTPGWTDYYKRVHYRTYDVTALVHPGTNAWGAILSDGWYSGYVGFGGHRDLYGTHPRARLQLRLDYADGSSAVFGTGPGWKANLGPITEADLLMGETYDARKELTGWDQPGYDDGAWHAVVTGSEVEPLMQAHPGPPVRVIGSFKAKTITEPTPGVYVVNLGQNFAGIARVKVSGQPGQRITLRFAERLNPDGTVYTTNLRKARATDTYICRGGGVETWEPHLTFHGFQYIEITGLTQRPDKDTVTGLALSSDTPVAGSFACSDPMLNQLHNNIYWTQRANFIDIPTDCPQRDERLGWTGDAQVYIRTATLNCDDQAFYTKWLVDLIEDGQRADGEFPMVAPVKVAGDDGGPAWADAGVICPWTVYAAYGDRRILERYYPAMCRFIAFCQNRSTPDLLPPAQYQCFGDWLSINADTPKDVICTAYFAYSTKLTARAAEALGKTADAARYNDLFNRLKAAFNRAYVTDDGRVSGDTQCGYVLVLGFDLVDGKRAQSAAQHLADNIEQRGWHLSTGFIGTKDLMLVLAKIGRDDIAWRLIHNDTFPSWGFSIKQGATSIWERWDGWTPEKGFQDPGMNSFAHYSFGAVYQWMVENIGGIRSEDVAYHHILIAPQPDTRPTNAVTSASTDLNTIRGRVTTTWTRTGRNFSLAVTIPANTSATVSLPLDPAATQHTLSENGQSLEKVQGVQVMLQEKDHAVLEVESGTYHFKVANGS